ncbi:TRIC cation channel family protein [Rosistilla carotiformis]|uniref:TRIC cation channel family protein n=1 Tax=Rosistilla carotiformis TaxID=2528017 RepID=UPI0011A82C5A
MIGDVICNRVPSLFRPSPMFATCSFVGSWIFLLLDAWPATRSYASTVGIVVVVAFRLAALRFKWRLPHVGEGVADDLPNNDAA